MNFLDSLRFLLDSVKNDKEPEILNPVINSNLSAGFSTPPEPTGKFDRMTYYTPRETPEYEGQGMLTRTGTTPTPGYSAAISPWMLKERGGERQMGDVVEVNGRMYRIEDVTAEYMPGTNEKMPPTLDIFQNADYQGGMERDVPYRFMKRDVSGLKYNYE